MGSPSASLRPTPPCATTERGFAPQREQRPESDLPSADTETYMLVGLRRSLARRSGPESIALQDVINGSCQGWKERPTGRELYNAFRAANPTTRQLALLRTWFVEATLGQLIEAWAQQAYSDRQLVESIHRIGFTQTDTPQFAVRIRLINSCALRW